MSFCDGGAARAPQLPARAAATQSGRLARSLAIANCDGVDCATPERRQPSSRAALDAGRPWIVYWIVHSLSLLGRTPQGGAHARRRRARYLLRIQPAMAVLSAPASARVRVRVLAVSAAGPLRSDTRKFSRCFFRDQTSRTTSSGSCSAVRRPRAASAAGRGNRLTWPRPTLCAPSPRAQGVVSPYAPSQKHLKCPPDAPRSAAQAVSALVTLGGPKAAACVDRQAMLSFLLSLKNPAGLVRKTRRRDRNSGSPAMPVYHARFSIHDRWRTACLAGRGLPSDGGGRDRHAGMLHSARCSRHAGARAQEPAQSPASRRPCGLVAPLRAPLARRSLVATQQLCLYPVATRPLQGIITPALVEGVGDYLVSCQARRRSPPLCPRHPPR